MKKRIIGGTIFVLSVYILALLNIFWVAILFFLLVGLYEMFKIAKNEVKPYAIFYLIIYLLGILSMYIISTNLENKMYILILISSIMLNDTFAYFVGRAIGKTKFSKTSPNKTIEGLFGGMIVTIVVFILYILVIDYPRHITAFSNINIMSSIFILVLTLIFAVIGDLLESKFKRIYNVKDSGTIIYGHGGILDRVDSWIVASIVFIICLSFVL